MAMAEKIKIVLLKKKMSITALAEALGTTRSNISGKLSRDNFSEAELQQIATALNCTLKQGLVMNDTGEEV